MNQDRNRRTPGRPREFDRDDVITRAVGAFWSSGFEATSLPRISEATGIDRSTLYSSFGGKSGLYASAAARYVDSVEAELFAPLAEGVSDDLSDVIEFLDRVERVTRSTDYPPGCFIVNDLRSPSRDVAATDRYLTGLQNGLRANLRRWGATGPDLDRRSRTLAAAVVGINAVAQHDADAAVAMLGGVRRTVRRWKLSTPSPSPDGSEEIR